MRNPVRLETFETDAGAPQPIEIAPAAFEEARFAAFEQGYSAGWDDAVAAQDGEAAQLRMQLCQQLQEMSFTFVEARRNLLVALQPLLLEMAAKVLPAAAREALPRIVVEQLLPLAGTVLDRPVTVVASPASLALLRALLPAAGLPLTFAAEPSLGDGQAYLKFPDAETRIDLDGVTAAITAAIRSYFDATLQETDHG
ncbi:flagellar biosynthesis protein [Sinirhodobacter ferrireducens]|uniref:Flagellar biosynthesis protein n=1 Tax=Paenirhodobacter ferrireducens TaxID=1215032 RepID=A0A443L8N0_9RHOB|nr:flagellar biosynthesis protein [Sinirhodobacter ferrireducens]RWR45423.1 flagellar biosynthesis protein [Sinirhodobacter ferrireducens]